MSTGKILKIKRLCGGICLGYIEENWEMLIKYNYFYHEFHINSLNIYVE